MWYDAAGRRTKQAFKSENRTGYLNLDTATSYTYNSTKYWLDRVQRQGSSTEKADYAYDSSDGRLTKTTYGNGATATYDYWASGALSKITHKSAGGTVIASTAYSYDKAGNVTKAVLDDALTYQGDATVYYYYDDLHRLTREYCSPGQESYRTAYDYRYTYDAVGNRNMKYDYSTGYLVRQAQYSYSARNELTDFTEINYYGENWEQKDWSFSYDLRGNLTKKEMTGWYWNDEWQDWDLSFSEYYWDSRDLMTKVVRGYIDPYYGEQISGGVEYKYDGLGRRAARKLAGGSWKWYFFDGLKTIAEGTGTNSKISYTLGPGAIGGILTRGDGSTTYTYHYDRLGSVMALTDSNGNMYVGYTMDAFGNVVQIGSSTGYLTGQSHGPPYYHLTTKEYDPDSQLYYFNARWYEPSSGRFISRDPAKAGLGTSLYEFCANNPLKYTDPTGEAAGCLITILIVTAVGLYLMHVYLRENPPKATKCRAVAAQILANFSTAVAAFAGSQCQHWLSCAASGVDPRGFPCGATEFKQCPGYCQAAASDCAPLGIFIPPSAY